MKIKGIDGKEYKWNLTGYLDNQRECSGLHEEVRDILKQLYPLDLILEEVSLPGSGGLFADFYLPKRKTMIECQGKQHYEFTPHFHRTIAGFEKGKSRDNNKEYWCKLNGVKLITLSYKDSPNEWRKQIR